MKIAVKTLFDCTASGVTGHYRSSVVPFVDQAGNNIHDMQSWGRSRNQQRNWETLRQVIGLRCQVDDYSIPQRLHNAWHFEFRVDQSDVFGPDLCDLEQDCRGVPMITGLGETAGIQGQLVVQGPDQNIWFQSVNT